MKGGDYYATSKDVSRFESAFLEQGSKNAPSQLHAYRVPWGLPYLRSFGHLQVTRNIRVTGNSRVNVLSMLP